MKYSKFLLIYLLVPYSFAQERLSFKDLWGQIKDQSFVKKRYAAELESAQIASNRHSRHWLPRAYFNASDYRTNDPGLTFFSTLGQRAVTQNDFIPGQLNSPGNQWFQRANLGVDMPLYEGGMKSSISESMKHNHSGKLWESKFAEKTEYSDAAYSYGEIIILLNKLQQLNQIKQKIDDLIKNYRVGEKSNLIGHSGILGLKNLENILDSKKKIINAQMEFHLNKLKEKSKLQQFKIQEKDLQQFIKTNFSEMNIGSKGSSFSRALEFYAQAKEKAADAEKARFLPRIGIFAERQNYWGSRNANNSVTAGLYFQWSLFNATDYGANTQEKFEAESMKYKMEENLQQERIAVQSLQQTQISLSENLKIIEQSQGYLDEQINLTRKLFLNGMVNALQIAEVYNRRIELIEQKSQLEQEYLKTFTELSMIGE